MLLKVKTIHHQLLQENFLMYFSCETEYIMQLSKHTNYVITTIENVTHDYSAHALYTEIFLKNKNVLW